MARRICVPGLRTLQFRFEEAERIVAVLVHGHANAGDEEGRAAYRKNLESVRRDFPDEIRRLIPNRNERREALRAKRLPKPAGMLWEDVPIITMRKEFWEPHFAMLARKLLMALHYKCFGTPLSRAGGLWYHIHTNADFAAKGYPAEVLDVARRLATPVRNKKFLNDQFLIRWNVAEDSQSAVFLAQLQNMLVITGFTTEEPERFGDIEGDEPLRPFGPWGA